MTVAGLKHLLDYGSWANRTALQSIQLAPAATPRASAILAHVIGAERLWLDRLLGVPPSMAVWPDLSWDQCSESLQAMQETWEAYLGGLSEADLDRRISYTNTKGERWENSIRDVLLHVSLHGSYHRGQIATLLRQSGAAPAYTDYIEAVRQGYLEE